MKKVLSIIKNNYIVIFCVYFITIFLNTTIIKVDYPIFELILKYTRYITYIFFFIRLIAVLPDMVSDFKKRNNKKNIILIVVLIFLLISIIGNYIVTRQKRLILLLLVLLSSYNTDDNEIISDLWIMQIILMMFVVSLTLFGFLRNYVVGRGTNLRYSLGFLYTTNLAQLVLFSTLLRFYVKKFKISVDELIFVQILNLFTYALTYSRTEFLFLELILIIMFIYCKIGLNKKIVDRVSKFFTYSYIIYPFLSIVLVFAFSCGGVFNRINNMLSNRLSQTYKVIQENGLSLFGKDIEFIGHGITDKFKYGMNLVSNYVDNEYIQLMLSHGVLFIVSFIVLLYLILIRLYKRKEYKKLFVCMIYLIFGLLNPRILNLVYSPIPFIAFNEIRKYSNSYESRDLS